MLFRSDADQFLTFDFNMISNADIQGIQSFLSHKEIKSESGEIIKVIYEPYVDFNNLSAIINMKQLSTFHIKNLFDQMAKLEKEISSHMLNYDRITFDPTTILYDDQKHLFLFRYLPMKGMHTSYDWITLLKILACETSHIKNISRSKYSLNELNDLIATETQGTPQSAKILWWKRRLFRTPETEQLQKFSEATIQKSVFPLLIDKINPQASYKIYFDRNTIGRDETSNVLIDDPSVSRQHALLYRDESNMILKDLNTTNGTLVNRIKITEKPVVNGDIIQFGNKEFIFIR